MTRAERIISIEANSRGVLHSVLMSECQSKTAAAVRAQIAYRLHTELGLSFAEIGRLLDRHHTSVIAMVRKVKARMRPTMPTDADFQEDSGVWAI